MTEQQKKYLMIGLGILLASYVIRSAVVSRNQAIAYQTAQARRIALAQQIAEAKAKQALEANHDSIGRNAVPGAPSSRIAPRNASPFEGVWAAETAIEGRGRCHFSIEIRAKGAADAKEFSAFPSMTCMSRGPLAGTPNRITPQVTVNNLNPEASVLQGTLQEDGSIAFTLQRVIGADSHGCSIDSVTITRFGNEQLGAEYHESGCAGGSLIVRKRQV